MNDKKMIEEMAKVIDDRLIEANNYFGSMNKGYGYWVAQKLVEHYQPKIPEGSVVLSREEYEILINQNKGLKEENHTLRLENNDFEAQVKELEEQRDRQAYIAEELIQEKHRWTEQARKETAKEIYSWLKEHTFDSSFAIIKTFFKEKYGVEE